MGKEDFVSTMNVKSEIVYHKVNTRKEKVEWLKIRWLQFRKDKPYEIRYRYSHNSLEAWKILNVQRKRPGRLADPGRMSLEPLYDDAHPIDAMKHKDLCDLMDFIPPVHHAFFNELRSSAHVVSESEKEDSEED